MAESSYSTIKKRHVFYDHNGCNDDFIGLLLLLASKNIELLGVSVTPAGCFLSDGVEATVKILDFFGKTTIPVGKGQIHGRNPFPYHNRASPKVVAALPQLIHLALNKRQVAGEVAEDLIIRRITESPEKVTMIITGPPANFVAALSKAPQIKDKIEEVVFIGGAVHTGGDVFQYNHDSSAEWNIYWDPESAKKLFNSGLNITIFPLDVTAKLPGDIGLLKQLAKQRKFDLSELAAQILAPTLMVQSGKFHHLMSDILAAAYVTCDQLATFEKLELDVELEIPSEGKLFHSKGKGTWVNVAKDINVESYRKQYLEILAKDVKKLDLSKHCTPKPRKVFYDHDGNNDDIISLQLVASMPHIELLGVSVTPADCLLDDGIEATLRVLSVYGKTNIPVAKGKIYGSNPFPYDWRINAKVMNGMPLLINQKINKEQVVNEPAEDLMIKIIGGAKEKVTVLLTGPCTNFAAALEKAPEIKKNVEEVVLMGGAVDVHGNVGQYNHDGSAEWNIFYDPEAARKVFASGLEITTFSLDSTNNVPVNIEFLKKLADQRNYSASYLASMLWAPTVKNIPSAEYTYFMWDTLAVAYLGCPKLCTFRRLELDVETQAPSEGKTYKKPGNGQWVNVADNVNVDGFFRYYLEQLRTDLKFDEE